MDSTPVAELKSCTLEDPQSSDDEYEDARDSPLEQCISDSIVKSKDTGTLEQLENFFSLVPSGVSTYKPSQQPIQEESGAISSPDSFSEFFQLIAHSKPPRDKLPHARDRSTLNLWRLMTNFDTNFPFALASWCVNMLNYSDHDIVKCILKNLVGKDVTKIALPVHLNEPLSFTQRLVEDIEYIELCHKAAAANTVHKRLACLAALASSCFVTTLSRHSKPFNPLLGETYELVNKDGGYCVVTEQVSHHPPVTAMYAESEKWVLWQEYQLNIKFRGQWVRIQPTGIVHFKTKDDGFHYSWNKPHTVIHNLILGSLWADHEGDVVVNCHNTGDKAVVEWTSYSKARERYRELNGKVLDAEGEVQFLLHGAWDKGMVRKHPDGSGVKEIWVANGPVPNAERQYGFTPFSTTLNEPDERVTCPTDSRYRPDQRLLENGHVDEAGNEKYRLEEKQRAARRRRESAKANHKPAWFDMYDDPDTGSSYHAFNGKYWECKLKNDWSVCPDIY